MLKGRIKCEEHHRGRCGSVQDSVPWFVWEKGFWRGCCQNVAASKFGIHGALCLAAALCGEKPSEPAAVFRFRKQTFVSSYPSWVLWPAMTSCWWWSQQRWGGRFSGFSVDLFEKRRGKKENVLTSASDHIRDWGRDCDTLSEGLLDITPNAHERVLRCVRRGCDGRVGVDGSGDRAADGVTGGRTWRARTLSL